MEDSHLALEEVLRESAQLGLDLSERTFRYYSVIGVLPRPVKRPGTDARVHYYHRDILHRLEEIRSLQSEGYSLKQIKKYFEVAAVAPPPEKQEPQPQVAGTARTFLDGLTQGKLEQASQRFLARAQVNLLQASLGYYADLLGLASDPAWASAALAQAVAGMDPLQLERLIRPMRAWRDQELERRREGGELPIVTYLRQAAARTLAGLKPEIGQSRKLAGYLRDLEALAQEAEAIETDDSELLGRVKSWLASALSSLCAVGQGLRDAVKAGDGAATAARLAELDRAQRRVCDLERLLASYEDLLVNN